jgi:Fe2+ transport system protein FeoA
MPEESLCSLLEMTPGQEGILQRVSTNDARILRYLSQLDIKPGRALRLVDLAPFNGPVTFDLITGDLTNGDLTNGDLTNGDLANGDLANGGQSKPLQPRQMLGSELAAILFVALPAAENHA